MLQKSFFFENVQFSPIPLLLTLRWAIAIDQKTMAVDCTNVLQKARDGMLLILEKPEKIRFVDCYMVSHIPCIIGKQQKLR